VRLRRGETQGVGQLRPTPQTALMCVVCGDPLAAHDVAEDGLCWRCAEDRDYADDQAMYNDLRQGG